MSVALIAALTMVGPACKPALAERRAPRIQKVREEQFPSSILALDLAATSNLAAVALSDGRVRVCRIDTGATVHEFTFTTPDSELRLADQTEPVRVRFSPNGKILAISHLSRIYLYDTTGFAEMASLGVQDEDAVRPRKRPGLTRRPDREEERTAQQMGEGYQKRMAQGDGATRLTDFAFTKDGSSVIAAYCRGACYDDPIHFRRADFPSGKDPVRLWALASRRLLWERTYGPDVVVERVVPSPDGKVFAAVLGSSTVQICGLQNGNPLHSVQRTRVLVGATPSVLFTADGTQVITFLARPADKKFRPWERLALYNVQNATSLAEFSGTIGQCDADLSPDGRWLVAPTPNLVTFKIYDVETRQPIAVARDFPWGWGGPPVDRVRFDPDGKYLVVASRKAGRSAVYQIGL